MNETFHRFLRLENHRLRLKHRAGGGGLEVARKRAELLDAVLRRLYENALQKMEPGAAPEIALIAIGGYGRGELNPFSDVDLLFLHGAPQAPPQIRAIIEAILYTLWDAGFKVGHVTHELDGALRHANLDMRSKTAFLETRFLAGERALFEQFKSAFAETCVAGHECEYIAARIEDQKERHRKNGDTVYLQEPNVKSGCGSLRDYQNLLWVAYFKGIGASTQALVEHKQLAANDRKKLDRAYDFLLRVRTELHYLANRGSDLLSAPSQLQIADAFHYPQTDPLRRMEAFMRDYYRHARTIYHFTETLSARLSMDQERPARKKPRDTFDGFHIAHGDLHPVSREIFAEDPIRLMRAFQHAQIHHLGLAPELRTLVRRRLRLVDRPFRYARAARETFLAILGRKGEVGRIARLMHECDFLGRYLPEFGALTCLVQHEFFHRYTADEHTLVCLEKLDALLGTDDARLQGYRALFEKLEDPAVLYLALLLHDTGKAANTRPHAEASAARAAHVAARLQLPREQRKRLLTLVDNHLFLSQTAQRRNLEDPATLAEAAAVIPRQADLDALMLLTLADGMGVGEPADWSDWKESLLWNLYHHLSRYLAEGEQYFSQRAHEREETRRALFKRLGPTATEEEIQAHLLFMPASYFHSFSDVEIAAHLRLFRAFLREQNETGGLAPAIRWIPRPERGHSEMWVCTWDRKNLLAKIAASLTLARLNILSADIYTRGDHLVLDLFRVCNAQHDAVSDPEAITLVNRTLTASLTDLELRELSEPSFHFPPFPANEKPSPLQRINPAREHEFPTRIQIDNETHPHNTLLAIQTPDRQGLLYEILQAVGETGANINFARIATEKGAAIDTFYITDPHGNKITDAEGIRKLQQTLQRILP